MQQELARIYGYFGLPGGLVLLRPSEETRTGGGGGAAGGAIAVAGAKLLSVLAAALAGCGAPPAPTCQTAPSRPSKTAVRDGCWCPCEMPCGGVGGGPAPVTALVVDGLLAGRLPQTADPLYLGLRLDPAVDTPGCRLGETDTTRARHFSRAACGYLALLSARMGRWGRSPENGLASAQG